MICLVRSCTVSGEAAESGHPVVLELTRMSRPSRTGAFEAPVIEPTWAGCTNGRVFVPEFVRWRRLDTDWKGEELVPQRRKQQCLRHDLLVFVFRAPVAQTNKTRSHVQSREAGVSPWRRGKGFLE